MTNKNTKRFIQAITVSLIVGIFFVSCYPLSTGAIKWRIKWDKHLIASKNAFLKDTAFVTEKQPNIILIVADDLGLNDVSSYGNATVQTPNIDALALAGVRCTQGYVSSPVCAPSRCGILTGRYQQRCGFETQQMEFYPTNLIEFLTGKFMSQKDSSWVVVGKPHYPREWEIVKQGIPPSEITIAELLKKYNYKTGIIGKWHLGKDPNANIPNKRGFDYQYGCYGAFTLYANQEVQEDIVNFKRQSFESKYQWQMARKDDAMIYENNKKIRHEKQYLTDAIRDRSIRFIEQHKDKPFFLYIPFTAPHEPYQAPLDLYSKEYTIVGKKGKAVYNAIIRSMDNAIGAIQEKLKTVGIDDNTMIVFLSDNGPATYTKVASADPLKGGKLTEFEGGIRVPIIFKWKNHFPENTTYNKPIIALDIFPTIAAAVNADMPNDRVYDGVDLIPFFTKKDTSTPHEKLFWRADHIHAIQKNEYKLIYSSRDGWSELYNLNIDPDEKNNLFLLMPEKTKELQNDIQQWENTLPKKPLWPRIMDHRFVIDGKTYLFPS
ncbi:MAG TPA: sulfatase-like hydrolase/transferase [Chitinophagales bacterium]|jgi:arylsulfatase A-like enzyme|nr:sulfatase-like hydrolase/transferase [Chitinophagales bacterium]HQG38220.1 sulfatase-like hydrolase/transferase [Chitinophagales bacterium]